MMDGIGTLLNMTVATNDGNFWKYFLDLGVSKIMHPFDFTYIDGLL